MSFWRPLAHGLRVLFNRRAADEAVGDEVQHYFDETVDTYLARGLSREDALRAARLEVGSVTGVREQVRESGWEHPIDNLMADLRYSVRRLRATPAFTLIAVSTLALGIGATTAVFSAVRPILIDTLPYPDAGRIAMVQEVNIDGSRNEGSFGIYRELVDRTRSFEALAVLKPWRPTLTAAGEPERLNGQRVSASYFRVLGVKPVMGRDLQETDDRLQGTNAVVLSSALWRRRFGGDPGVVGRSVVLDDVTWFIAGVMPTGFRKRTWIPKRNSGPRCSTTCRKGAPGVIICERSDGSSLPSPSNRRLASSTSPVATRCASSGPRPTLTTCRLPRPLCTMTSLARSGRLFSPFSAR